MPPDHLVEFSHRLAEVAKLPLTIHAESLTMPWQDAEIVIRDYPKINNTGTIEAPWPKDRHCRFCRMKWFHTKTARPWKVWNDIGGMLLLYRVFFGDLRRKDGTDGR